MKKYFIPALYVAVAVAVFVFLGYKQPWLMSVREESQLWLCSSDYLWQRVSEPGGVARYLGEFIVQSYYLILLGSIVTALLFFIMLWLYKTKTSPKGEGSKYPKGVGTGFYFGLCLTYIFTFRFFVEFFKKTQVEFEDAMPLDMGQLLSIPFVIVGIYYMFKALKSVGGYN